MTRIVLRMVATGLLALAWLAPGAALAQPNAGPTFDHFTTGFPLDGAHLTVECESCHVGGVFQGTPFECSSCHSTGGRVQASAKPVEHVLSTNVCEDCHRTASWFPLREMNHDAVFGSCSTCHNNVQSVGMPPGHPQTQQQCDTCHRTTGWLPALFDHDNIMSNCAGCHDGVTATGKTPGHIATTNVCEDCHSVFAFTPATAVDHTQVLGSCSSCHNGSTATGKHATHLATTAECNACHSTTAFLPALFDHANVPPGTCSSCHNGTTSTGKPVNHFTTQLECDHCHSRDLWLPLTFVHQSATYPGDHAARLTCADCHTSNAQTVPWPFPAFAPDCAGCHAQDYKPSAHQNASVSQNRDCAGTCHQSRPEHSVRSREW